MSRGVQLWYYTRSVPARAVAVAEVSVPPLTSAQLTSINNTIYEQGPLSVWKSSSGTSGAANFTAPDYNQPVEISGDVAYFVGNQFFQLTNVVSQSGAPLFYQHTLPAGVTGVTILDLNGNVFVGDSYLTANTFFHSFDGSPYYIRYVTQQGYLTTTLLHYDLVFSQSQQTAFGGLYELSGSLLTIGSASPVWLRFTAPNGFQTMPMYGYLPNAPWYPRIRFGIQPPPVDWGLQRFVLPGGILQGTYVPGTVLNSTLVEFERKQMYYDPQHLPDILVYDKNNVLKYALDGSSPTAPPRKGTLFNWKRGRIQSLDPINARVNLTVTLDPTDIVYGFYNYFEPDVVYTGLDVNPFTNPAVKNSIIQFYVKTNGTTPSQNLFYQVLAEDGSVASTNDPTPGTGTNHFFSTLVVGANTSVTDFTYQDVRVRGGGLAPAYQSIPQATSFFDIGYWDGQPFPIGGALVVYLPLSILDTLSRGDVRGKVEGIIPMGAVAVIRYFDNQGNEYV